MSVMKNWFHAQRFWKTSWWEVYMRSWKSPGRDEESKRTTRENLDDSEFVQKMYLHKLGDLVETFP